MRSRAVGDTIANMLRADLFHRKRIAGDLRALGLENPVYLGRTNHNSAHGPLLTHRHQGLLEIFYIARGRQIFQAKGRYFPVASGQIYFNFPGEAHGSGEAPQERNILYWFQIDPKRNIAGLDRKASREIAKAIGAIRRRVIPGSSEVHRIFDELVTAFAEPMPRLGLYLTTRFAALCLEILACADRAPSKKRSNEIERVLVLMEKPARGRVSLRELAGQSGLSLSRFKERFVREVGMPPGEYLLSRRIEAAKTLLISGKTVTEASLETGFPSSQYFATAFRRFTGRTPSAFRSRG